MEIGYDHLLSVYKDKTVLVTGDTGFKGSWLAIWLRHLGAKVIGFALSPRTQNDNYVICRLDERITHIQGDIRDYDSLLDIFSTYKPEIVFHLAAQALVLDSYKDPLYTFHTNVMGTVNILEAIRNSSCVRAAVNVTSDKCYENKERVNGYREVDPLGGKDPYSASKGVSEIITSSYLRSFFSQDNTANIASARSGNAIGGGDWSPNRIIPDCMRALQSHRPIIIRKPDVVRPWQHVLDPLYGYLRLASRLFTDGKTYSGAWNFGPSFRNSISVRQLVEEVIKKWGSGRYVVAPSSDNRESSVLSLDISKALNQLNWYPVFDLKKAVEYAIEEYRVDSLSGSEILDQRIKHIEAYLKSRQENKRERHA